MINAHTALSLYRGASKMEKRAKWPGKKMDGWMSGWVEVTHPSTAGERSGLLLTLDRYLL